MSNCPCGSESNYDQCCGVYHRKEAHAPTAEKLMRARYSAYVLGDIDYIARTLPPMDRKAFDRKAARMWSDSADWQRLEILSTKAGGENDKQGTVEFCAVFLEDGKEVKHHEIGRFKRFNDRWMFVDGKVVEDESQENT